MKTATLWTIMTWSQRPPARRIFPGRWSSCLNEILIKKAVDYQPKLIYYFQETVEFMSYVAIGAVILFVVGFATGPGSIPWFFVTELFAQSGRPTATSIAVSVNWSANFLVGLGFSPLQVSNHSTSLRFGKI